MVARVVWSAALFVIACLLVGVSPASAELCKHGDSAKKEVRFSFPREDSATQFALVIGNRYTDQKPYVDELPNPEQDAREVAQAFASVHYRTLCILNASASQIVAAIEDLRTIATRTTLPGKVVFYFAGHGGTLNGSPFIVPADIAGRIDAIIHGPEDPDGAPSIDDAFLPIADLVGPLYLPNQLQTFVFIDACRSNISTADIAKGLHLDPSTAGSPEALDGSPFQFAEGGDESAMSTRSGLAVFVSTQNGMPALDAWLSAAGIATKDGPFAHALADYLGGWGWPKDYAIASPDAAPWGAPPSPMAPDVRFGLERDVKTLTNGEQHPDAYFRARYSDASLQLWDGQPAMVAVSRAISALKYSSDCNDQKDHLITAIASLATNGSPDPALEKNLATARDNLICKEAPWSVTTVSADPMQRRVAQLAEVTGSPEADASAANDAYLLKPDAVPAPNDAIGIVPGVNAIMVRLNCHAAETACAGGQLPTTDERGAITGYADIYLTLDGATLAFANASLASNQPYLDAQGEAALNKLVALADWKAATRIKIDVQFGSDTAGLTSIDLEARARQLARSIFSSTHVHCPYEIQVLVTMSPPDKTRDKSYVDITVLGATGSLPTETD